MSILAVIGVLLRVILEVLGIYREVKNDKKKEKEEIKKKQTEHLQSIVSGVIDNDESRINTGFDNLRILRMRSK